TCENHLKEECAMPDFLFRGDLAELDPDVAELVRHETARQARYIILIPSESTVPAAVREALGSAFHNIYAEGYPLDETRTMPEAEILDYGTRLPEYRRSADNRIGRASCRERVKRSGVAGSS